MDVWKNAYISADLPFMEATATDNEIESFLLRPGDVLLTKDSETPEEIAEPSLVRDSIDDLVLGYHLALLRPNPQHVLGSFLAAQLRAPQFRAQFVRVASGATRYGLTLDAVSQAEVWLPGIAEQRRIAEILTAVDDAIEATRAVIDQTRHLKTALLQDLLTHGLPGRTTELVQHKRLGQAPREWTVVRLADLLADSGALCYGVVQPGEEFPGGVPMVRVCDIEHGDLDAAGLKTIDPRIARTYSRSELQGGELLVTLVGTIGRCAIAPPGMRGFNIARAVAKVPLIPSISARYVMHFLNSVANTALVGEAFESARKTLNLRELATFPIALPARDEQEQIVAIADSVGTRGDDASAALQQLARVKSALSQALLTGRVQVRNGQHTQSATPDART